jgi:hypothetical protein
MPFKIVDGISKLICINCYPDNSDTMRNCGVAAITIVHTTNPAIRKETIGATLYVCEACKYIEWYSGIHEPKN